MGLFGRRRRDHLGVFSPVGDQELDSLVASAATYKAGERDTSLRKTLPPWQRQALEFYDLLGECHYPAQFYARMLSRVRLYPGIRQPNGEVKETDNEQAQAILARIKDKSGGRSEWQGTYGRLQFTIGDGYLAGMFKDGAEVWGYYSPAELRYEGAGKWLQKGAGQDGTDLELREAPDDAEAIGEGQIRTYRLWTPHPANSSLADSPIRPILSSYEYLMLVDKAARAQALSRIVGSGLLVVDSNITIADPDPQASDDAVEDDPFMRLLTTYITTPIKQPGSAAAVAPLVARVEIPEGRSAEDLIKLIQLHDPNQTADWMQKIEKTIWRIAISLDMPPEEFLGLSGANHWTGWVITEEKWKGHGEPLTIQLCADITGAYYREACIAADVPDAENMLVWYDAAQVVTHPDRGKDALAVSKEGELSGKALRRHNNFNEEDAPTPEERAFHQAVKLKGSVRPPGERPQDPPEEPVSDTGSDVAGDAPRERRQRTSEPSPQANGRAQVVGAAMLALERCRELAGSRLISKRMQCEGCFKGAENVPKSQMAATVGIDVVRMLEFSSERALVAGGAEPFLAVLVKMGVSSQRARAMSEQIEHHAAETLYEESPTLPDGFAEEH